jgi:STE24 endopeptidase
MTATGIARAATLLLLAVGWVVSALLLLRTSVPSLHLDGLDVHGYFTDDVLGDAHRYERFVRVTWLLSVLATIGALLVLVRRAPRLARGLELGPVGGGIVLGMVTLVTLWFVELPFGFADQWWARRHGLGTGDYATWLLEPWALLLSQAVSAMVTIAIVVGLARWLGDRWWIAGAPAFAAIVTAFAFLSGWIAAVDTTAVPYHFRDDIARLEAAEGVVGTPVRVDEVSDFTNQVNAFTVGMGPSTHVILWDTLLMDPDLNDAEVDAVIAHELGHVKHRHIWKTVAWFALFAFPLAWSVARVTRRQGGMRNPGAVPLAVLTLVVLGVLTAPFENAVSRRYEAEADWEALKATRDPKAVSGVFQSFAESSLAEPNPPVWDYLLLENHPTLAQRIAMAEEWRRRSRAAG